MSHQNTAIEPGKIVMLRVCAWCKEPLGDVPGTGSPNITHGICDHCGREAEQRASKEDLLVGEPADKVINDE